MIRVENCPHICFPIVNVLTSPIVNLSGQSVDQMPRLDGKCLMIGHYDQVYPSTFSPVKKLHYTILQKFCNGSYSNI